MVFNNMTKEGNNTWNMLTFILISMDGTDLFQPYMICNLLYLH